MKKYLSILSLAAILLSGCSTPQSASSGAYSDDVYYSSKDVAADNAKEKQRIEDNKRKAEEARREEARRDQARREDERNQELTNKDQGNSENSDEYYNKSSEKRTDNNGDTYITNNYYDEPFNYDDYYDYEYATRLRRFHNNVPSYGYYDNYYTNAYWYTYDPFYYGTSIYMGYSFWGPTYAAYSYNPGFYFYSSCGWGYDPWYHPYGYNPYNPYMYGYGNGYYDGYNHGYYNGYNNYGYNNNYFNSYDNNSYYYGPRKTTGSNARVSTQPTLAHRYMAAVEEETHKPFEETHGRNNNPYIKSSKDPRTVSPNENVRPVDIDNSNRPTNRPDRSNDKVTTPVNPRGTAIPSDNNTNRPTNRPDRSNDKATPVNPRGIEIPDSKPQINNDRPSRQAPEHRNENQQPQTKPDFQQQKPPVNESPRFNTPREPQAQPPVQHSEPHFNNNSGGRSNSGGTTSPSPRPNGPRNR